MVGKVLKGFISEDVLNVFRHYSLIKARSRNTYNSAANKYTTIHEPGIGHCIDIAGDDSFANALMLVSLPKISKTLSLELSPVASFYRVYGPECILPVHIDQPEYEWSATICMGYEAPDCWPIFIEEKPFYLEPGDCLLYQGAKHGHGRRVFNGSWQTQLFLHYKESLYVKMLKLHFLYFHLL